MNTLNDIKTASELETYLNDTYAGKWFTELQGEDNIENMIEEIVNWEENGLKMETIPEEYILETVFFSTENTQLEIIFHGE